MDNKFDVLKRLYHSTKRIRRFEEVIADIYPSDKIKSPIHLAIGQELPAALICALLRPSDIVAGTYRSHALYLAKGGSMRALMAEMFGKASGCCKGKGGSMHVIDTSVGLMGTSAVVGTGIPNATGAALALKYYDKDDIVVCFLGDGATEEGVFYETLNFAALHALPIIFVCENNGFAIHSPSHKRRPGSLKDVVQGLGIFYKQIDDPARDFMDVYSGLEGLVGQVRRLSLPVFLDWPVYRYREHVGPGEDYDASYRSDVDKKNFIDTYGDAVEDFGAFLTASGRSDTKTLMDVEIEKEIAAAVVFAEFALTPDAAELLEDVYAE
jgi:TPP-dependent pyruvate/acetoin dehydrogenase alpha subunit